MSVKKTRKSIFLVFFLLSFLLACPDSTDSSGSSASGSGSGDPGSGSGDSGSGSGGLNTTPAAPIIKGVEANKNLQLDFSDATHQNNAWHFTPHLPGPFSGDPASKPVTKARFEDNRLLLTDASTYQLGVATNNEIIFSSAGEVAFELALYGDRDGEADGWSFFAFDAQTSSVRAGFSGNNLGYLGMTDSTDDGKSIGYFGVGFDQYNSATNNNRVILWGSTVSGSNKNTPISSKQLGSISGLTFDKFSQGQDASSQDIVTVVKVSYKNHEVKIEIKKKDNSWVEAIPFTTIPIPSFGVPKELKFGFGASTGSSVGLHAVNYINIDANFSKELSGNDIIINDTIELIDADNALISELKVTITNPQTGDTLKIGSVDTALQESGVGTDTLSLSSTAGVTAQLMQSHMRKIHFLTNSVAKDKRSITWEVTNTKGQKSNVFTNTIG